MPVLFASLATMLLAAHPLLLAQPFVWAFPPKPPTLPPLLPTPFSPPQPPALPPLPPAPVSPPLGPGSVSVVRSRLELVLRDNHNRVNRDLPQIRTAVAADLGVSASALAGTAAALRSVEAAITVVMSTSADADASQGVVANMEAMPTAVGHALGLAAGVLTLATTPTVLVPPLPPAPPAPPPTTPTPPLEEQEDAMLNQEGGEAGPGLYVGLAAGGLAGVLIAAGLLLRRRRRNQSAKVFAAAVQ